MHDHHKIFYGFVFFMVILFIAWIISGGPTTATQTGSSDNRFIQLNGYGSGTLYNNTKDVPQTQAGNVFQ